ncbi:gp41 protein [Mycobacteroides abscessus]|uniref:site-specific integrase n=1 Tax=Mycobacteroides abscessus TaxID=36809 RepID=UPI0005E46419|nr:tyrosine-type recombinase/integrase [Mycobacteroides abscessus]CPX20702.1 gp41 protein [Mycobacteroides abscessus]CRG61249.1 gp41 protein [Mycobacteroides abscessus]
MARQQLPPQIKKRVIGTDAKGRDVIRYEVVVDIGSKRGKRKQTRRRFTTETAARAFLDPLLGDQARGLHVAPNKLTVKAAVEAWLRSQRIEQTTRDAYTAALRPLVEQFGDRPVQSLTKADIEWLVEALINGDTPRGAWAATTINPFLARTRSLMDDLVGQGVLARNPAALVKNVRREDTKTPKAPVRNTLTAEQGQQLLDHVKGTEDEVLVMLALLGMRRSEIIGLRWSHVDLDARTLRVAHTVVSTSKGVQDKDRTKTEESTRELPLPDHAVDALRRARARWTRERLASGSAWRGDKDGHVFFKPDGTRFSPKTTNNHWNRAVADAGLDPIVLHGGRHTAATLLLLEGAPLAVVAAWLGHANGDVTMRVYAHAQKQAIEAAASTFDGLYGKKPTASAE